MNATLKTRTGWIVRASAFAFVMLLAMGCQTRGYQTGNGDGNGFGNGNGWANSDGGGNSDGGDGNSDGGDGNSGGGNSGGGNSGGGNSGGGNSGGGNGGIGFNGPLGDVTAWFLNQMGNPPSYWQSSWPFRFRFSGPKSIQVFTCNKYDLELLSIGGAAASIPNGQSLDAMLTDSAFGTTNSGAFFKDSACKKGIGLLTFRGGESTKKTVYYMRPMVVPSLLLKADARWQAWNVIGRYHIKSTPNSQYQLPICFNFEDMFGRGGDNDFNDVVVNSGSASLYVTPEKSVKSYNNQRVALNISGTSACDAKVRIEQRRNDGQLVANKVLNSAKQGGQLTFDMVYQDQLKVFFTSKGGCASGEIPSTSQAVRVSNTCRKASDEGQRWQ